MEPIIVVGALFIYFLPTIVVMNRKHHSRGAVFALNLLLGWTFIGWVVSFVWAFSNSSQGVTQVVVNNQLAPGAENLAPPSSKADELEKLAQLKDKGLLTDDEFNREKQQLLASS